MDCLPTKCRYLSQASQLLVILDPDGTIRHTDRRNARPLGYAAEGLRGKPLEDLVPESERSHVARLLERTQSCQPVWDRVTFLSADRSPEPMLCCFQPLPDQDGRARLLVTGLATSRLAAALQTEAAGVLGHLAYQCHGPAHRLMRALEVLRTDRPDGEQADTCRRHLDALLDTVCRHTAWTSPGGPCEVADVVAVLEEALGFVDADPSYQGLAVSLRPSRSAIPAQVDPVGLTFVALHLVANARDAAAGRDKPALNIDVHADDGHVIIEFLDNGAGLEPDDLRCAFSPGFSKGKDCASHTGLGLATCAEVVRAMGGTIRMESRPGEGTTVILTFAAPSAD